MARPDTYRSLPSFPAPSSTTPPMRPPVHPVLQEINRLARSSPGFKDQLSSILHGQKYHQCVPILGEGDSAWLVNYLDETLDGIDLSGPAFGRCLYELRRICGAKAILPTSYTLSFGLLKTGLKIFSGVFSDMYEGTIDGSRVCVKSMRVYRDRQQLISETFRHEAVIWKRMKHPRVLPLQGIATAPEFTLISDFVPGGSLREYIKKHPNADRLGLLSDIAEALHYLHSRDVIHGGINGLSVLVDETGRALIADFGHAAVVNNEGIARNDSELEFAVPWAAPETLTSDEFTKLADIFSFAMLIIEVSTGAIPFGDHPTTTVMLHILQGRRPPRPKHPAITARVWKLIQRCWDEDPCQRPEAAEVLRELRVSNPPAWKQLIAHTPLTDKCIPLIMSIFSDRDEVVVFEYLSRCDAQAFVDVVDKSWDLLYRLPQQIWMRCLRVSYKVCDLQALLPESLQIPLCYKPFELPCSRGGFADIWKGEYLGQMVAAKALRVSETDDFNTIRRNFCREVMTWRSLNHPNVLPLLGVMMGERRFVMVSKWMENGNINEFLKKNPNEDRPQLLRDVTVGLIYMHHRGIVHGDLKGANVLIDNERRACLADFSLVRLAPDHSTSVYTYEQGGTYRWMSPELFNPRAFDPTLLHPTKNSDCYALGMVIYEVLSDKVPFEGHSKFSVCMKVLADERPKRPEGEAGKLFTDDVWGIVERCWGRNPGNRASAREVLVCLGGASSPFRPSSPDVDESHDDAGCFFL